MITFDIIKIQGFGSIVKPLRFMLNQKGLNIIRGRVGSGKTTIPSALCWGLFGKTLKNKSTVETWEELRGKNYRGTKVDVVLYKNENRYNIIRCSKFRGKLKIGDNKVSGSNKLFILKDGELVTGFKNKNEQQDYINKLIGYSFDLFKSSIVFGQKLKRIIEESGPDKKKIFEEGFMVNFIEEAKENVKTEKIKLEDTLTDKSIELDRLVDKLLNNQENYKNAISNEKKFEKIKKERIDELDELIEEISLEKKEKEKLSKKKIKVVSDYEESISKLEEEIEGFKSLLRDNKDIENKAGEVKEEIEELKKQITEIKKGRTKKCNHCGQIMGKKDKKHHINHNKEKIRNLKLKYTKLIKSIKPLDSALYEKAEKKLKNKKHKLSNLKSTNTSISAAKKQQTLLDKKLTKLNKKREKLVRSKLKIKSVKYEKKIKKLENKISALKKIISNLSGDIKIKEWLIKDPLSNNGLKAYLFDNLVQNVNVALSQYADIMGFLVEFGIDLDSHRKDFYQVIMQDNIIIPYEDLSGGQKQLVDTTVAFAIHDVISEMRPTNILFLDEPFESLGLEEVEIIEELVEKKAKEKCLFLITHHQSFNPRNANEIVVKRGKNKISKFSLK